MSNTVFSISLDKLHLAKVEEIMKTFPNESRNKVIKRCITSFHAQKDLQLDVENLMRELESRNKYIKKYQNRFGVIQ